MSTVPGKQAVRWFPPMTLQTTRLVRCKLFPCNLCLERAGAWIGSREILSFAPPKPKEQNKKTRRVKSMQGNQHQFNTSKNPLAGGAATVDRDRWKLQWGRGRCREGERVNPGGLLSEKVPNSDGRLVGGGTGATQGDAEIYTMVQHHVIERTAVVLVESSRGTGAVTDGTMMRVLVGFVAELEEKVLREVTPVGSGRRREAMDEAEEGGDRNSNNSLNKKAHGSGFWQPAVRVKDEPYDFIFF